MQHADCILFVSQFKNVSYILHWLQAMGLIGGMIGSLPAGWVADRWGRKVSVAVSGIVFAAGYAIIAFAKVPNVNSQSFKGLLMVGRLITGIASGWTFVSTPVSYAPQIYHINEFTLSLIKFLP